MLGGPGENLLDGPGLPGWGGGGTHMGASGREGGQEGMEAGLGGVEAAERPWL